MSRRSFASAGASIASALLVTLAAFAAGPQEQKPPPVPPVEKEGPIPPPTVPKDSDARLIRGDGARITAAIDKLVDAYDLKPQPLPFIPDNPPPHEGALKDLPYIVEPPDLIIVEVLEALPGRPISGERLVRPDGTITLGFYGDVYVRGLTLPQVKVAVIKHLRNYIADEILGLMTSPLEADEPAPGDRPALPSPDLPDARNPLDDLPKGKGTPPDNPTAGLGGRTMRAASFGTISGTKPIHFVAGLGLIREREERQKKALEEDAEKKAAATAPNPIVIPFPGQGQVKITIEIQGQNAGALPPPNEPHVPPNDLPGEQTWKLIPPQDSGAVFVDVTAYNSKNYFVLGHVHSPGRLPCTGGETVLDAIQYAGGLEASADARSIILVRPGRNGGRARTYPVNLDDIRDRGDVVTNYQLFPGDRLIVGSPLGERRQAELRRGDPVIRPAARPTVPRGRGRSR